jgi:hypothetical protein
MESRPEMTDVVNELTGGRPYCFVVMPYRAMELFYDHLSRLVADETAMLCVRADDVIAHGYLRDKIHEFIERATLVIAEISECRPNVFYELGYAVARQRPILHAVRRGASLPVDLQGLDALEYDESTRAGMESFDREFVKHVRHLVREDLALLRRMLMGNDPQPSYIICSPRWPDPCSSHERERRTYGDYLGLAGIVNAFGALLGAGNCPDLIGGKDVHETVPKESANLYLIASPKANDLTAAFLDRIQKGCSPGWRFVPEVDTNGDPTILAQECDSWKPPYDPEHPEELQDFGLVVRGPHPEHPDDRMVLIMAGQHSLGSGAACLAATHPKLIAVIESKLPQSVRLRDKRVSFWALVRGRANVEDEHLDWVGVDILDVGVYKNG